MHTCILVMIPDPNFTSCTNTMQYIVIQISVPWLIYEGHILLKVTLYYILYAYLHPIVNSWHQVAVTVTIVVNHTPYHLNK